MHEMPIVRQVLKTVLDYAESRNATQVKTVFLEIGQAHDLVPELVEKYFAFASKGTVAEGAQVLISRPPVAVACRECQAKMEVDLHRIDRLKCLQCGGERFHLISGKEFMIRGVEIAV